MKTNPTLTLESDQPRKADGKYYGAAAATSEAYEACEHCETRDDHLAAAALHDKAAELHKADGNDAMAKQHKDKAADLREKASAMQTPGSAAVSAASPANRAGGTPALPGWAGETPPSNSKLLTPNFRLESGSLVEAPTTKADWNSFMAMAGGIQTITLGCTDPRDGVKYPLEITLNVNPAGAAALQAQLEAVTKNSKQRVFNCFDHGGTKGQTEASSWPQRFFWKDGKKPGIYEAADPSDTGFAAIEGKRYRGFSLTFHTNADITPIPKARGGGFEIKAGAVGSPDNPAEIICPDDVTDHPEDYLNMGTLTNRPSVVQNEPLFASRPNGGTNGGAHRVAATPTNLPGASAPGGAAGARTKTSTLHKKHMEPKQLDAAALQARNEQLEQRIQELEAEDTTISKAELRAVQSELEANHTKIELATERAKIVALEAAETGRKKETAQNAVKDMINSQQIPALDKELQASWEAKFIADPALIALVVRKASNGRVTASATALEAGRAGESRIEGGFSVPGSMKKMVEIINRNTAVRLHGGMSRMELLAAYEQKGKLALEAGLFYRRELGKNLKDWEDIPISELGKAVGLEASFQRQARPLEAADYTDPAGNLGTLSGTLVLQRTLPIFALDYPELMSMYTDFSDTPGLFEQTEDTRIIQSLAVQKYDTTLDTAGRPKGWDTVSPAVSVDAPLTLTDYIAVPIVFGQQILGSTTRKLFDEFAAMAIKAIAGYFTGMMTKLITPVNFNAYVNVTAPDANGVIAVPTAYTTYARGISDFSMTDLDKLSAIFTPNKVPRDQRGILLSSLYYAKLRSDPRLEFFFAASKGDPMLTQQKLPDGLSGFFPYEAPYLPMTNNLQFFPYHKAAIMLKSRLPTDFTQQLGVMIPGSMTTITDPDTKISIALVQYVNLTQNFAESRPEVMLGAAVGDSRGGLCGTSQ